MTARGFAWTSPEETVVVYDRLMVVCFLYTDVAKTTLRNFRRVGTAFSGKLPKARTVLLVDSYSPQIFPRKYLLNRPRK